MAHKTPTGWYNVASDFYTNKSPFIQKTGVIIGDKIPFFLHCTLWQLISLFTLSKGPNHFEKTPYFDLICPSYDVLFKLTSIGRIGSFVMKLNIALLILLAIIGLTLAYW